MPGNRILAKHGPAVKLDPGIPGVSQHVMTAEFAEVPCYP
jgi:hypothetical protein